jgi:hypothetical protein
MRFFTSVLVGAPLAYLGTVVLVGEFEEAAGLIAISILCTAGVGLVFWIPVCWINGFIARAILSGVFQNGGPPSLPSREVADRTAMERFLRQSERRGESMDEARERLREEGWDDDRVRTAVENVSAQDAM